MKVAVIGAGPAGLAFLKELREGGHDAVCFEATHLVGGTFARPYDGARLTSSNLVTSFSDFRDERDNQLTIWDFQQYTTYLNGYVDRFDLRPHIRLGTPVTKIRLAGDDLSKGLLVTTEVKGYNLASLHFDRVAICTGSQQARTIPEWPGADEFQGEILHALDFVKVQRFAGKRVLIVGAGESASDIALEVSRVAAASGVSVRGHFGYIVPRNASDLEEGKPNEGASDIGTTRVNHSLPHWYGPVVAGRRWVEIRRFAESDTEWVGPTGKAILAKIAEINLAQGTSSLTNFGLKNAGLVRAMVERGCRHFPAIKRFERNRVVFVDDQTFGCDCIICGTGYSVLFPALAESFPELAEAARKPRYNLYKHCVHPDYGQAIFFGGYARPAFGAIPPIAEMQARWFALLCSGELSLPSAEQMRTTVRLDNERALKQFPDDAARIATLTDFLRILDDIAELIGCRPPQTLWLTDRPLWRKIMFGPITGAQFRLKGPGAKPAMARESLMRTPVYPETPTFIRAMIKFKLASLVPWLGRRYRLNATW